MRYLLIVLTFILSGCDWAPHRGSVKAFHVQGHVTPEAFQEAIASGGALVVTGADGETKSPAALKAETCVVVVRGDLWETVNLDFDSGKGEETGTCKVDTVDKETDDR